MQRGLVITLAASTNRATERARSSRIVEKEETSFSGTTWAANGGFAPTTNMAIATPNLERIVIGSFPWIYAGDFKSAVSTGSVRIRVPVAAKIALVTAGATAAVGASPKPPGDSALFTRCVSTTGASFIRMGR